MKRRLQLMATCAAAGALTAGVSAAQDASSKNTGEPMTYTGCVAPGEQDGVYVLTDITAGEPDESNDEAANPGEAPETLILSSDVIPIAAQDGHSVTVMGTTVTEEGSTRMLVESLLSNSGTCA